MKFLIDMPVSPELVEWLKTRGYDSVHTQSIGLAQTKDADILRHAKTENRIVITADLDFGRLLALGGQAAPGVVLFRGGNYSDLEMCGLLARVLDSVSEDSLNKSICVVDRRRVRVTRLPLRSI